MDYDESILIKLIIIKKYVCLIFKSDIDLKMINNIYNVLNSF